MNDLPSGREKINRRGPGNSGTCYSKVMPVEWGYLVE